MSETVKQRIERETREYFNSVSGKSGVEPAVEAPKISQGDAELREALYQARRELRDLIHSDYCSKGCRPRCTELTRLLGEK